jgi:YHS domain-containing protein
MKTVITSLAVAALVLAASAQMGHHVSKSAKHVITCPVSGDKLDIDVATKKHLYADYKGSRYYFCCPDCPPAFKKNPAKYASKPHVKTPGSPKGVQKATILVDSAFSPSIVTVKAGHPFQLTFDTKEAACASTVIFDGLDTKKELKDGMKTVVTFPNLKAGTYAFHCPMNMIKGKLIVQ